MNRLKEQEYQVKMKKICLEINPVDFDIRDEIDEIIAKYSIPDDDLI